MSESALRVASRSLAGGVNSNFRLGIQPTPLVIKGGDGAWITDQDGNSYIDYYLGMGPVVLGHCAPQVTDAVIASLSHSNLIAGQTEYEIHAAEILKSFMPSLELLRFCSSGTEAAQAAIRLARAATKRRTVVKFFGHYHGWLDNIFWGVKTSAGSLDHGDKPASELEPLSAGMDEYAGMNLRVLRWNDIEVLSKALASGTVAAVVMEPIMCNAGMVIPDDEYIRAARSLCDKYGTLLIFDEVITGMRVALGGAQEHLGVIPDLTIMGKALGNGFPVGVFGGRADLMEMLVNGNVMHGGTYNGQTQSMAAVVATLSALQEEDTFATTAESARRLAVGIREAAVRHGVPIAVRHLGSIIHIVPQGQFATEYERAVLSDRGWNQQFAALLLESGVRSLERGTWFVSSAHRAELVDRTVEAVDLVLSSIEPPRSLEVGSGV